MAASSACSGFTAPVHSVCLSDSLFFRTGDNALKPRLYSPSFSSSSSSSSKVISIGYRFSLNRTRSALCFVSSKPSKSSSPPIGNDYLVKKVTGEEFEKLLDSELTTHLIVDFYATWCGPCVIMAQQLEMLAVEYNETATFVKIDTDEQYELSQQLQIRGLPTVLLISKDREKPAIRTEGVLPMKTMRTLIETEL